MNNVKLAKYEWIDDTGLCHPSLIVLDATEDNQANFLNYPVLQVRQIYSIAEYINRGKIIGQKLPRMKGYKFDRYAIIYNRDHYALFLFYKKIQ